MRSPIDQPARDQALNPADSVIIQAPAGSGKTGLLIRRYLRLLAEVDEPEQVLGITFTRKATAEMRERILDALRMAKVCNASTEDSELMRLSAKALKNDQNKGWGLLNNTRRLRIQTIDSLCSELVQRMPWSARFGAPPTIVEDAEELYREAARRTLSHIEDRDNPTLSSACGSLMVLLDANLSTGTLLISGMLDKRDKWMRLLGGHDRRLLESWWQLTIDETLSHCFERLTGIQQESLTELAAFAAENVIEKNQGNTNTTSRLEACRLMSQFPEPNHQALAQWQGIADLLLLSTRKGLRKSVDARSGFPTSHPALKRRMMDLLESMQRNTALEQALIWVSRLPEPCYADQQWKTLDAILELLPIAVAELKILFSEANQTDYIELAQRAELALGGKTTPSDLALVFDYQLKHILVDEFQDTSTGQISLIEKLLEGWQAGDGRTAFFVGDPMQSIYRFREAEVANFLHTQTHGIGPVSPRPLVLQSNFRSDPAIVHWVNEVFTEVMPDCSEEILGAVSYAASAPYTDAQGGSEVRFHPSIDGSIEDEANEIVDLVASIIQHFPDDSIAILGRTRAGLNEIARSLEERGLPYQGIKLQKLEERQAIQDLLALALAIQQPSDRTAWLGLMRAPWCGFDLSEMYQVCGHDKDIPVIHSWSKAPGFSALTLDSKLKLENLHREMGRSMSRRGFVPLWKNLEATWTALGGPACIEKSELDDCQRFIELVRQLENQGVTVNKHALEQGLRELWASADSPCLLQLLTIHAAKGLEFDTVILPGLHRQARHSDPELLRFHNLPDKLLLAPKPSSENKEDPFYRYLGFLEKEHLHNETSRLLYVACTRARRRLHVFGNVRTNARGELSPPVRSSMLSLLWPSVEALFENVEPLQHQPEEADQEIAQLSDCSIERMPSAWQMPELKESVKVGASDPTSDDDIAIEFDWAGENARICGVLIHRILQNIDRCGWTDWCNQSLDANERERWRRGLIQEGMALTEVDAALLLVEDAILNTRSDPDAAWIFSTSHQDIRTEWPLTGVVEGQLYHCVIDRSFVDDSGIRWIIDFKSSRHEQKRDLEKFISTEIQRYQKVMDRYAFLVGAVDARPVRKALYYPVLQRLEEL